MERPPPTRAGKVAGVRLTRLGWYHVLVTFGLGVAALRTGNNLLYVLLGIFLGLLLAHGLLQSANLSGLVLERTVPREAVSHQPFLVSLSLKNTKRWIPSFGISVEEVSAAGPTGRGCYFLALPPGGRQRATYRYALVRRGWFRYLGAVVSSSFPLGFVERRRFVPAEDTILGLPLPRRAELPPIAWPGWQDAPVGAGAGRREVPRSLRPYLPGDDIRDLHHKASAHLGRLVVREYEASSGTEVVLVLDEALEPREGESYQTALEAVERAIGQASYLARLLLERGFRVALLTRRGTVAAGSGPGHWLAVQRFLATLSPAQAPSRFPHLEAAGRPVLRVDRAGPRWQPWQEAAA